MKPCPGQMQPPKSQLAWKNGRSCVQQRFHSSNGLVTMLCTLLPNNMITRPASKQQSAVRLQWKQTTLQGCILIEAKPNLQSHHRDKSCTNKTVTKSKILLRLATEFNVIVLNCELLTQWVYLDLKAKGIGHVSCSIHVHHQIPSIQWSQRV